MKDNPNILFLFSDQQHWEAVEFMDSSFQTPTLNRLASEGMVFRNAFCTTPQCSPSRSSIMTGFYPSKTGVLGNVGAAGGNPLQMPTIAASLQKAGYHTAYFGKWHLGEDPLGNYGWDEDCRLAGSEKGADHTVTQHALSFLGRVRHSDRPFALFLSYNNPHDIYHFKHETAPLPNKNIGMPRTWHGKDLSTVPSVQKQFMTENQGRVIVNAEGTAWERYREMYREKVKLYDDEINQVLDALDGHDQLDTTLVIATSDHGDMDGQHRLIFKGPFMYEHMMRVPLIIRPPAGCSRGPLSTNVHTVNVDLVPTMADFAGITLPGTDGVSLKPLIDEGGEIPDRKFVVGQYYSKQKWVNPIRMIRTERYKYNRYQTHGEELYDLEQDPEELENLAADAEYRHVKEELEAMLNQWIKDNDDPFYSQTPTAQNGQALPKHFSATR